MTRPPVANAESPSRPPISRSRAPIGGEPQISHCHAALLKAHVGRYRLPWDPFESGRHEACRRTTIRRVRGRRLPVLWPHRRTRTSGEAHPPTELLDLLHGAIPLTCYPRPKQGRGEALSGELAGGAPSVEAGVTEAESPSLGGDMPVAGRQLRTLPSGWNQSRRHKCARSNRVGCPTGSGRLLWVCLTDIGPNGSMG